MNMARRALDIDGFLLLQNAIGVDSCDVLIEAAKGQARIVMPHRHIGEFEIAMRVMAKHARKALGDEISGLGSDYFGTSAGFSTHTDNDHVQALPGTFVSVWVPLVDITHDNGPLAIRGLPILCKKGDALLIDGDALHRSCAGKPGEPRPVALFTYIQKGKPFRPGTQQQRAEVLL